MEQQPQMTIGQSLQWAIANQTGFMEELLQSAEWTRQYVRAGRMLVRVLQAHMPAGSDAEQDAQALANFMADFESWSALKEEHYRERYTGLALVNHAIGELDLSHPSDPPAPQAAEAPKAKRKPAAKAPTKRK